MKNPIKIVLYAAFGVIFCSTSACRKTCKSYTQCETVPIILEYFGNYKPGNYWIYENQDGTKRDSMWVSDYEEGELKELNECIKHPVRKFILHTEYWTPTKLLNCKIDNGGNCNSSYFNSIDSNMKNRYGIDSEILNGLSDIEKSEFFELSVGIRKFYANNSLDTFILIKHFIK